MNETLADIVAGMRDPENDYITNNDLRDLADRIEAAAQREKVEAVTIAATKAVNLTDQKWRRDTGNATALREALVKTLDAFKSGAIRTEWNDPDSWKHDDELWYLKNDIESALAAPARNCDRFADEDDAFAAWHDSLKDGDIVSVRNAFRWLFATAALIGGA